MRAILIVTLILIAALSACTGESDSVYDDITRRARLAPSLDIRGFSDTEPP